MKTAVLWSGFALCVCGAGVLAAAQTAGFAIAASVVLCVGLCLFFATAASW